MKPIYRSKLLWLAIVLLLAALVVRAMAPIWVRNYVNRKLSEIDGYRGHVADIDIHLWRGAYTMRALEIKKVTGNVPVPFFAAPIVDLSVQWGELFHGAMVGEINFERPKLNFVNSKNPDNSQVGVDKPWAQKVKELFPVKINRFTVNEGEVHYRDFSRTPKVDVVIDRVDLVATNLTNSLKLSKSLHADIEIKGRPLRDGTLATNINLDPYAQKPTFTMKTEVAGLPLVKLNDFAKAYASITFESGTLRVATEMESKEGRFRGYVEPVFDNMSIFDPAHDADNPIDFIWQGIVGGITRIIRNHPKDRFGTRVPINGSFDNPAPAVLETVFNVVRNAFVKAFTGKLGNENIDLEKVQQDPDVKGK
ncbi:MAG: DUF748 domain-containing protein [Verrucomicrobiota bacterium]|nr:DUF748 domain-containing protein [Verrucomicrobiota bacterium]